MAVKKNEMKNLARECATEHCKDNSEPGKPHCAECAMVSVWAADAAKKRELGIYPSRQQGNHSVERIEAIQNQTLPSGFYAKARVRKLCSNEQLEAHASYLAGRVPEDGSGQSRELFQ
jgi:hypothetical protein